MSRAILVGIFWRSSHEEQSKGCATVVTINQPEGKQFVSDVVNSQCSVC